MVSFVVLIFVERKIDIMTVQLLLSFMAYYGVSVYDDHDAIAWDFNHDMIVNMSDLLHLLQF